MNAPGRVNGGHAWRGDRALLCLVGLALFFWRLGSHDLWPPDEPRFANVAREMQARGDCVVLSLNDRLYTDKPPLFFWAINAFGAFTGGVDEWSARLPSAVAGLLGLFLIYHLGRLLYDRRVALLASLIFATASEIAIRARWASIDMTLNLFVLASIVLLWRASERDRPGGALPPDAGQALRERRFAWMLMGLATLAKGPVGLILPLLAVLPVLLLERDVRGVRRVFVPSGVVLYLAVTLAWFGRFAHRVGLSLALDVLVHQNVDRYLDAPNSQHPVWFFLWRFPIGFFPWSLFLPWGIAAAFADREPSSRRRAWFLTGWAAAIFLFFSFSAGKRGVYIIPLFPAVSLLTARVFGPGRRAGAARGPGPRAPFLLWLGASLLTAAVLRLLMSRWHPDLIRAAGAVGAVMVLGAVAAVVMHRAGRGAAAAGCIAASMALATLLVVEMVVPWADRYQNMRGFGGRIRAVVPEGAALGAVRQKRDVWVFYAGRFVEPLDTGAAVLDFLSAPGLRYVVIDDDTLRAVRPRLPAGVGEVARSRVADDIFSVLVRDGRAEPGP